MKVRIINTKENPVIIKSDKKPPFVDRPSFANGSLLFAPYKQGYTTPDALYKLFGDIKQGSIVLYIDGEKIVSFSDDFFNGSKTIYMPIQTDGIIAPGCISLNTKQTDIVDEDIQEVIKMLELSCTV